MRILPLLQLWALLHFTTSQQPSSSVAYSNDTATTAMDSSAVTATHQPTDPTPQPTVSTLELPTPQPTVSTLELPTPQPKVTTLGLTTPQPTVSTLELPTPQPKVTTLGLTTPQPKVTTLELRANLTTSAPSSALPALHSHITLFFTSYNVTTELDVPSTSSHPPLETSTQTLVTTTSRSLSFSTSPSAESPTDSSPNNIIRDNPIAFTIIGITALFLTCVSCCLCFAMFYRKRKQKRRKRRTSILEDSGNLWMANPAVLRATSSDEDIQRAISTLNVLQASPGQALILSNPQSALTPPPQYHELQNLSYSAHTQKQQPPQVASQSTSAGLQHSSSSRTQPAAQNNACQASAPPQHHIDSAYKLLK